MKKQEAIELRQKVQKYFKQGMKKQKIAEKFGISRPTLNKWLKLKDPKADKRGWQKGKKRRYTDAQEEMVIEARKKSEWDFFLSRGFTKWTW